MKIALTGHSGFIGSHLTKYFTFKGHTILSIGRNLLFESSEETLSHILSQADVVINLSGAPINRRWNRSYKEKIYDSRIKTTRKIVRIINRSEHKPELFISASAVGIYPANGCYDEYSPDRGNDFLTRVCNDWETEAQRISSEVRLAITRFGVVFASEGGAFEKMSFPAKFGVSAIIGSGKQFLSWIDITDLTRGIEHILLNPSVNGPVNFVAPGIIPYKYLAKKTGEHYRALFTIKIPDFFIRFMFGESSDTLLKSQCINSLKLQESGFVFNTPSIDIFFENLSDNA